jgi:Acetyltransferase (GNAT) domain
MSNSDKLKASALKFCRIDNSFDISELLQRIKEILVEGNSHNAVTFSEKNWIWQYKNLPSKDVRIYVCLSEDKIVGYYHVPVYEGTVEGARKKIAVVQDVAVSIQMRGQNVFRRLAEFATSDLAHSNIDLVYTFPNEKSIHTFLKYNGYKRVSIFDSYILPVDTRFIIQSKFHALGAEKLLGFLSDKYFELRGDKLTEDFKVCIKDDFDEEVTMLFQQYNAKFVCHLNRTQEYLRWRFLEKPGGKHFLITLQKQSKIVAAAVFKIDEILKIRTAVVLDFAFELEDYFVKLLYFVRNNTGMLFSEKINMLFVSCCRSVLANSRNKLIKIPLRFNPRPLNLLVRTESESEQVFDGRNWLALLSDWDVL